VAGQPRDKTVRSARAAQHGSRADERPRPPARRGAPAVAAFQQLQLAENRQAPAHAPGASSQLPHKSAAFLVTVTALARRASSSQPAYEQRLRLRRRW